MFFTVKDDDKEASYPKRRHGFTRVLAWFAMSAFSYDVP